MKRPLRNGFTLVELLVVVAVIGLLISILLPALKKAREQAQRAVCLSNHRQLINALYVYAHDNKGSLPPAPSWMNASATVLVYIDPASLGTDVGYYNGWAGIGLLFN